MRNAVPWSLGEIGKSAVGWWMSSRVCTPTSTPIGERASSRTVPCTMIDASCLSAKIWSPTSAFDITACTMPLPSRTCKKCSLPLEAMLYSQPFKTMGCPTCCFS